MENSNKYSFISLLKDYKIQIPIIQRDYAQGRNTPTIKDIRTNFLETLKHHLNTNTHLDLDFVYGSIKRIGEDDVFLPLDGQQRLTTLFLLHWYICYRNNGALFDECKQLLSRFTYETRSSSRDFCRDLVDKQISNSLPPNTKLSEKIKDSNWYFFKWDHDPTIGAMLVMLDEIQYYFKKNNGFMEILMKDNLCPITFQFMQLEHFGLDDSLYIKMNARGKILTDFENFKAKLIQKINGDETEGSYPLGFTENFSKKLDSDWCDLFWKYRNLNTNLFDDQYINFIVTFIENHYVVDNNREKNLNVVNIRGFNKKIGFSDYEELILDDCFFKMERVLDLITDKDIGHKQYLTVQLPYMEEESIFKESLENRIGLSQRLKFYAYCAYFIKCDGNIIENELMQWLRITRNLIDNTQYNYDSFCAAMKSLDYLSDHYDKILHYFATENIDIRFGQDQVREECYKAKLIIQDDKWYEPILAAENHPYFRGQISFLLEFSNINESNLDKQNVDSLTIFRSYSRKCNNLFDINGLTVNINLFRRALLCMGDYLLKKGQNHSFLGNSYGVSWKRLIRDDKRKYLKKLLDQCDDNNFEDSFNSIIEDSLPRIDDWRLGFICYEEIFINVLSSEGLIRRLDYEDGILLLGSTQTSGYCSEYNSYVLYCKFKTMKNDGVTIRYYDSRGRYNPKRILLQKKEGIIEKNRYIEYDQENKLWLIKKSEESLHQKKLKTKEDVLVYLNKKRYIRYEHNKNKYAKC